MIFAASWAEAAPTTVAALGAGDVSSAPTKASVAQPAAGPPDVVDVPVSELSRVSQSPPVMGVLAPGVQAPGSRLQASGTADSAVVKGPGGAQENPHPVSQNSGETRVGQPAQVAGIGGENPHPIAPNPGAIRAGHPEGETRAAQPQTQTRQIPAKYDIAKIGDRKVGKGFDLYSLDREQLLGKELASEVEQSAKLVKDPVITEYVNRIGQNLVRNSDARVPFTIKVIDNDEVNAFALPGGFFYVNTGLILAAENEAELAGVMAHEIAHVAARHATKNATRSQIFNLVSIPLIFVGGPAGYAARQVIGLAVPLSFLKFSRDAEREADLLGLEYQYACGYDPEEFVRFFEKLHKQEKRQKHGLLAKAFATHPMTGERVKKAQQAIEQYLPAKNEYIVDTS